MKIDVFVVKKKKEKKIRIAENAARMNLRVSINPRLFQIILSSPPPPSHPSFSFLSRDDKSSGRITLICKNSDKRHRLSFRNLSFNLSWEEKSVYVGLSDGKEVTS